MNDLTLPAHYHPIAVLEAAGKRPGQIAEALGCGEATIYRARQHPLFIAKVNEMRTEIEARVIEGMADNATRLTAKVNAAADGAVETLIDVSENGEKDGPRVTAAIGILDQAPDAPKVVKHAPDIDARTIIQFSARVVEQMTTAMSESGREDIVDLLPDVDYTEGDSGVRVRDVADLG